MTGRRLDNYTYILEDKGNTIHFDLEDEVIIHMKNRKGFIKGEVAGVSGEKEVLVTTLHVRDLRYPHDLDIPITSIESLEVINEH